MPNLVGSLCVAGSLRQFNSILHSGQGRRQHGHCSCKVSDVNEVW